jgi:hypothetical protein
LYPDVGVGFEAADEAGFADAGLAAEDGLFVLQPGGEVSGDAVFLQAGAVHGDVERLVGGKARFQGGGSGIVQQVGFVEQDGGGDACVVGGDEVAVDEVFLPDGFCGDGDE